MKDGIVRVFFISLLYVTSWARVILIDRQDPGPVTNEALAPATAPLSEMYGMWISSSVSQGITESDASGGELSSTSLSGFSVPSSVGFTAIILSKISALTVHVYLAKP